MRRRIQSARFLISLALTMVALITVSQAMAETATPTPYTELKVAGASKEGTHTGLYSTIVVQVDNLAKWAQVTDNDPKKFILYMDGNPLKGIPIKTDKVTEDKLYYDLQPSSESEAGWKNLLGSPGAYQRNVSVTVGLENMSPLRSAAMVEMTIIHNGWLWVFIAATAILLFLLVWLARRSDLLRDAGPDPTGQDKAGKTVTLRKTYSLGRTQMAVWFVIVVATYVFIWMVTSSYGSLSNSVLALIGISAGTALGGAIIDVGKRGEAQTQRDQLTAEKATLEAAQQAAPTAAPFTEAQKERLNQVNEALSKLDKAINPQPTSGFFRDIISDANGVSFHRFQMAVWTLVLGFIFIVSVYHVLTMPDFPGPLLGLLGISGGTYLGFKFPENPS